MIVFKILVDAQKVTGRKHQSLKCVIAINQGTCMVAFHLWQRIDFKD